MPIELLAGLVAVEAKALVDGDGGAAGDVEGEGSQPLPQQVGAGAVVDDDAVVVADVFAHDEPARGGDGGICVAFAVGEGAPVGAFGLRQEVIDDDDAGGEFAGAGHGDYASGVLAFALVVAAAVSPETEQIRVAVGRFPAVVIEGEGVVVVRGDGVTSEPAAKVSFSASAAGLLFGGKPFGRDLALVKAPLLKVAGHTYRGVLEVRFQLYDKKPELLVVHPLDLETYVTGIVSAELPRGWPLASYQAQAVAARTFALSQKMKRIDLPYHMESTVLDQVYGGVEREHALAEEAAQTTRGQVLSFRRHLAQTFFHASCGGRTESARDGWATPLAYLPGSTCNKCTDASRFKWSVTIKKGDLDRQLKKQVGGPVTKVEIVETTTSGRAKTIAVSTAQKTTRMTGGDFRRLLGWSTVWSTLIDKMTLGKDSLVIDGRGSGHGVGLCQWGARGFAQKGATWQQILTTYYPTATLARVY